VSKAEPTKRIIRVASGREVDERASVSETQTSSSNWGARVGQPSAPRGGATRDVSTARKIRSVTTVVTAEGIMKTVPTDPSRMLLTEGHSWMRHSAGDGGAVRVGELAGASMEVTPVVVPPAIPPAEPRIEDGRRERRSEILAAELTGGAPASNMTAAVEAEEIEGQSSLPVIVGAMSAQSRQELSTFISTAVVPRTNRVYEKEWALSFNAFVKTATGSDGPFLTKYSDDEKASLVALIMMRRQEAGRRGKAATSFTAAVLQMFARTMRATAFFDSSIVATARTSCLMKPDELRAKRDSGTAISVKLPICEGILTDLRRRAWVEGWGEEAKKLKALYAGTMYGFETASMFGEFTHCEVGNPDHCARVDDFAFVVESGKASKGVLGSGLAALQLADSAEGRRSILEFWVRTVSSKGKVVVKPKLIARRSQEEASS
jgi:hypothetical protein